MKRSLRVLDDALDLAGGVFDKIDGKFGTTTVAGLDPGSTRFMNFWQGT